MTLFSEIKIVKNTIIQTLMEETKPQPDDQDGPNKKSESQPSINAETTFVESHDFNISCDIKSNTSMVYEQGTIEIEFKGPYTREQFEDSIEPYLASKCNFIFRCD